MRLFLLGVMAAGCLRCGHVQPPVERRTYVISEGAQGVGGSGEDSCHQEHVRCFDTCLNTVPPYPHKKGDGWHHEYCTRTCREAYMECVRAREEAEKARSPKPLEFSNIDKALVWLREHKTEVALGTVVVVAGVAFVVATGGGGMLLLVPLAI